jgi:glycosyltransferase involved in cell wall biosynthesis
VKVAYFSPLPPERSGIADYSALLLPALSERIDVTVAKRGKTKPPRGTDVALYHVGNNPEAHGWIVDALRRRPGIVVLHDFVLHHLVAGVTLGRGDVDGYLDAMQRDAGVIGRLLAHGVADQLLPPIWEERAADFPLTGVVLDRADGVICHSRFVERKLRDYGYAGPIAVVPMPAWPSVDPGESAVHERGSPVIGCLGYLNRPKRIPELLQAFDGLRERFPEALLVLGGSAAADMHLEERAVTGGVLRLEHLDEGDLWRHLAACDVVVSLRSPTMGETSGMVLRALSLGKPLVVSDVGWFSELPAEVAAKVPVDEHEVETLTRVLGLLAGDDGLRRRMGAAALAAARTEHELGHVADLYVGAIEEFGGGSNVRDAVARDVAKAAHEVGIDMNDPELSEVAARAREVGLGN